MKTMPAKSKRKIARAFRTYPEKGAEEYLRVRQALQKAGETCDAARRIADESLAIWPRRDSKCS